MRKVLAVVLGVLLPLLGFAGAGQAQSAIQVQGTIQAVDCAAGTVVLSAPIGSNTISAADYTAVLVNSTSVPFCSLQEYIGAPATAWLIANGDQFSVTQIDVTGPIAAVPAPVTTEVVSPVPIVDAVLGTILVAGLVYLLVHGPDDDYYRYPYYGDYYRHYYRPEYRPFTGYYPASAPIITVAPAITGLVLGIVVVNSLQYILARDDGGHLHRYPYYGPYHQYYYRQEYRSYSGAYGDAPVRQGDPGWDAPAAAISQTDSAPAAHDASQPVPVLHQIPQLSPVFQPALQRKSTPADQPTPQRQLSPVFQPGPQRQASPADRPAPQRQQNPIFQPGPQRQANPVDRPTPQRQLSPVFQPGPQRQANPADRPTPQRQPVFQNNGRGNAGRGPSQQCGGRQSDQSCSSNEPQR